MLTLLFCPNLILYSEIRKIFLKNYCISNLIGIYYIYTQGKYN